MRLSTNFSENWHVPSLIHIKAILNDNHLEKSLKDPPMTLRGSWHLDSLLYITGGEKLVNNISCMGITYLYYKKYGFHYLESSWDPSKTIWGSYHLDHFFHILGVKEWWMTSYARGYFVYIIKIWVSLLRIILGSIKDT